MLYKTNNDKNIVINTSIIDDDFYPYLQEAEEFMLNLLSVIFKSSCL